MLDVVTKNRINTARNILVGKVTNPISQVQQITFALIYKFMNDMDKQSVDLGGEPSFFKGKLEKYSWDNLISNRIEANPSLELYSAGLEQLSVAEHIPLLFRKMFKNAFIPYRDGVTFKSFIKVIDEFDYSHSEKLGDAFEFLLSILGSQGDAGQFRTPRHIIDFMVELMNPQKNETVLDPACGTAGFLISAYKHIIKNNSSNYDPNTDKPPFETTAQNIAEIGYGDENKQFAGDKLKGDERVKLEKNISGYDISPEMVQFSLVNFYLHQCKNPQIHEYDSLTSTDRWNEEFKVILANPPFMTPKGGIRPHDKFGVKSNRAEVLFVDYIADHLSKDGRAAIIVPEGVIFQSANAYKQLRQKLIDKNLLVGVISLPAGVFNPYSGVKTSILWLDKTIALKTDKIFFAKVEADGFDLGAQRRPNNKNDLPEIFRAAKEYVDCLASGKEFAPGMFKNTTVVEKVKIAENGEYNFSADRYLNCKPSSSDFPIVSLGDVCELYQPKTITSKEILEDGKYKVFGANGIIGFYDKYNHEDEEVLVTCRGATCGTINLSEKFSWITGNAMVVKPKASNLDKKYLYWILKKTDFASTISGAAQPQITRQSLSPLKIPIPPLEVQQEILAEIKNYQTNIDANKKLIELFEAKINRAIGKVWGDSENKEPVV